MVRRSTLLVVILFMVLLAVLFYWQRTQDDVQEATPTPASAAVFDIESANINGLRLEDINGSFLIVERDETGGWTLVEPRVEDVDVAAIDNAISQLLSANIQTTLNDPPAMADLGLDPPIFKVLIVLDDGSQALINVGKEAPTGAGYYVLTDDRKVIVVSTFSLQAMLDLLVFPPIALTPAPAEVDSTPQP